MTSAPIDAATLRPCLAPFPDSRSLPREAYLSPEVFEWEIEHFFGASWTCVGRASDLAEPGDQRAVVAGSEQVLLARDAAGELRGFSNTCRHRGHELLPCGDPAVNRRVIQCPYHSWTYALDGRFKGAPLFATRPGFDRRDPDHGLVPLPIGQWGGWIFVNVSGDAPALAEHVGNLDAFIRSYEPERLFVGAVHDYEVRANWKVVVENYNECYHCSEIHPELCRISPPNSGEVFEPTGTFVGGSMELHEGMETMSLSGRTQGVPFPNLDHKRRREVHYFALFPNLLLSLHPDYVMVHRVEPRGVDRTWVECAWLFPPESRRREGFDPSYAVEFWDLTNRQDWVACESVQRGMRGRGYRQAPLAEMEVSVQDFMALVARGYLEGRVQGPLPKPDVASLHPG